MDTSADIARTNNSKEDTALTGGKSVTLYLFD